MGVDKLDKYARLINDIKPDNNSYDPPESTSKVRCASCGRLFDYLSSTACVLCNDNRLYCSYSCMENHNEKEHYNLRYCAHCNIRISTYTYIDNMKINNAFGKEQRFCSDRCINSFREKHFCAECNNKLPDVYKISDNINNQLRKQLGFCSLDCLEKYTNQELCSVCGRLLGYRYKYCIECGEDRYKFCNNVCYNDHARQVHGKPGIPLGFLEGVFRF